MTVRYRAAAAVVVCNDIPTLEQLVTRCAKQITRLDAMLTQAEDLDEVIDLTRTELDTVTPDSVRTNLIALITKARDDQQRLVAYYENLIEWTRRTSHGNDV